MKTVVSAFTAFVACAVAADARIMVVDGDDVRGGMNVVTNVDLSGFVTNVDSKVDSKTFVWSGTNTVAGAEYAEKAKSSKEADVATRALRADSINAAEMTNVDALFDNIATNKSPAVTTSFSNAVASVSADAYLEAVVASTNLVENMTQAQKTRLLKAIVDYIKAKENISEE